MKTRLGEGLSRTYRVVMNVYCETHWTKEQGGERLVATVSICQKQNTKLVVERPCH